MRIWLIAIALVALAACSSQEGLHEPAIPTATATSDAPAPPRQDGPLFTPAQGPEMADPENFNQADQDRCAAAGGSYEMAGILGWYRCTISFADAGTACTDNSDCMGQCRAENGGAGFDPSGQTTGQSGTCQVDDSPFGCYATVQNGQVTPPICVD